MVAKSKFTRVPIILAAIVFFVAVMDVGISVAGGGWGEPPGSESRFHLQGPAIVGTITLTDTDYNQLATLVFDGKCKGQPVHYESTTFPIYDDIYNITEKCTSCDGTDSFFEKSYWAGFGDTVTDLALAGCTTSPNLVLETVTKFQRSTTGDGVLINTIVAEGVFLFQVEVQ